MKKISLITLGVIGCLAVAVVVLVLVLDNSNLKPSKDHVTDFVAIHSPYAVRTLYDAQHHPIDIVVVNAKSGAEVVGISDKHSPDKIADRYEVKEINSSLIFTLYDAENKVISQYEFDTDKKDWVK